MKLSEILKSWEQDAKTNIFELDNESLNIPILHHKYVKALMEERRILTILRRKEKTLVSMLMDYYAGNLNNPEDLEEIGRDPYPLKHRLKEDLKAAVNADDELNDLQDKITLSEDKIDCLKEILKQLDKKGFHISNAIKWKTLTGDVT